MHGSAVLLNKIFVVDHFLLPVLFRMRQSRRIGGDLYFSNARTRVPHATLHRATADSESKAIIAALQQIELAGSLEQGAAEVAAAFSGTALSFFLLPC